MPKTPPKGLGSEGRRLWRSVSDAFELEVHEEQLLLEAARTADVISRLVVAVGDELVDDKGRIRPELVELRAQRILFARLVSAMRVPIGTEETGTGKHGPPRLQRRAGVRGMYSLDGGAA